ncbi:MAG: Smr/MutS family protein [Paracoccaceae bacterium]
MKGRKLRPEELDLWKQVAQRVAPIERAMPADLGMPPKPAPKPDNSQFVIKDTPTLMGGKRPMRDNLAPTLQQSLQDQPVAMDRKAYKKMQRGKLRPDARIDLHGMTLERAHNALNKFVMASNGSGKRLLLVITGKGKQRDDGGPIPVRHGVLRHQVPEWLRLPPLSSVVLQVTQAHMSHGGGGAYYVYLRRSR